MQPKTEIRPWGRFIQFTHNEPTTVKIIVVNPQEQLSLQYHEQRREFWRVLSGHPLITIGDTQEEAHPDDEFIVEANVPHRITAQDEQVTILEIAFGTFDENDIVRLEDNYGRN